MARLSSSASVLSTQAFLQELPGEHLMFGSAPRMRSTQEFTKEFPGEHSAPPLLSSTQGILGEHSMLGSPSRVRSTQEFTKELLGSTLRLPPPRCCGTPPSRLCKNNSHSTTFFFFYFINSRTWHPLCTRGRTKIQKLALPTFTLLSHGQERVNIWGGRCLMHAN